MLISLTHKAPPNQLTERTTNGQRKTNRKMGKGYEDTVQSGKSNGSQTSEKVLNLAHGKRWKN